MKTDFKGIPADIREAAAEWVARRDAGLDPGEERDLDAWLSADPRHAAALARFDSAWRALDQPLRTGTADRIIGELSIRATRRSRRRHLMATAACTLTLLIAVGFAWNFRQPELARSSSQRTVAVTLPAVYALPDGSMVESQDAGEISVEFNDTARRVTLQRGGAHFQVTKDPHRPFVVIAGSLEVRAVGTAFSVRLGPGTVEVLVTSGQVAVDLPSPHNSTSWPASPAAGSQTLAIIDAGNGVVVGVPPAPGNPATVNPLAPAQVNQRLAWRSPRLEFSGTPLIEAVALLNRHNDVQFTIADPDLAATRVSGVFGAHNTAAFIQALEGNFDVKAERRGENEIVIRRAR